MRAGTNVEREPRAEPVDAETLFRAHAPFVASFLRHMGTPEADLDDLVQEVFVVAHRKGGYQPGPALPRSWLTAIAYRIGYAERRARSRRSAAPLVAEDLPSDGGDPAEALESQRSLRRLQAALEGLPSEHRAAFVLYELEGESCESIAATLDVPIGTVYSRLHHARNRVLQAYQSPAARPHPQRGEP